MVHKICPELIWVGINRSRLYLQANTVTDLIDVSRLSISTNIYTVCSPVKELRLCLEDYPCMKYGWTKPVFNENNWDVHKEAYNWYSTYTESTLTSFYMAGWQIKPADGQFEEKRDILHCHHQEMRDFLAKEWKLVCNKLGHTTTDGIVSAFHLIANKVFDSSVTEGLSDMPPVDDTSTSAINSQVEIELMKLFFWEKIFQMETSTQRLCSEIRRMPLPSVCST